MMLFAIFQIFNIWVI